jgi:hypothetical protein
MTKFIIVFIAYLMSVVCNAQVSETRKITEFSKVEVETGIELIFTESSVASLLVESDDEQRLQKIITKVEGNTLKIYLDKQRSKINNYQLLRVTVSQNNVSSFRAKSGASIAITNEINVPKASITIDSGAEFKGNIKADVVKLDVNSGANYQGNIVAASVFGDFDSGAQIELSGIAKTTTVKIGSAANCQAIEFTTQVATIDAGSSAEIALTVSQVLDAKASSLARIKYYGTPMKVSAHTDSLGKIQNK